jgi:prepilin-type N-terminal cleavage/methylation domain-containing protein
MTRPTPLRLRARAGFSMIELIAVLTIVGITFGMSAGRIHDLIIQERIARAATAVQNDLEAAFAIATRNRRPIRIVWSADDMQLYVTDRDGTITYRHTGLGRDPYGLKASNVSSSWSFVEVFPNGMSDHPLSIWFNMEHHKKTVEMSRTGMVVTCVPRNADGSCQ